MRILHVVGMMDRGGAETWLMHVLRALDRGDFHMDFMVHSSEPAAYDDEIREAGSLVLPCLEPQNPVNYARHFKSLMSRYGPYDIIHSHVHYFTGYIMRLAHSADVRTLIAHSHTDNREREENANVRRKAYLALMRYMLFRYADCGLAVSKKAAEDLFGPDWSDDPRWRLLYCGVDLGPFKQAVDRAEVRRELGIPEGAFVVGHVGSFNREKNHDYLIDIVCEVAKADPDIRFLMVGDGNLRPAIEKKVESLGLVEQVVLTGVRADVPRLMLGAMDAFILPSLHEGLPLVLMEAEAAGLPCVFSDVITDEADIVEHLAIRLSVDGPPAPWAAAILELRRNGTTPGDPKALAVVEQSAFNITKSVEELVGVYESYD